MRSEGQVDEFARRACSPNRSARKGGLKQGVLRGQELLPRPPRGEVCGRSEVEPLEMNDASGATGAARPATGEPGQINLALVAVREALGEVHHFWHECLASYHEAEVFRHELNALVQATRNVTFRLQSHKAEVASFDVWYGPWQDFMKADALLSWVNEARVQVVKQKGLDSKSRARLKLTFSHLEPVTKELEVPASLPTPLLVAWAVRGVPQGVLGNALLEITRRWVVEDVPGEELLGAFARAYLILDALSDDLERFLDDGEVIPPKNAIQATSALECMDHFESAFTVRLNPATGQMYEFGEIAAPYDRVLAEEAEDRYGVREAVSGVDVNDPEAYAKALVEVASRMLERDGHHITLALFHRPEGGWQHHVVVAADKLDKYLIWQRLAEGVREHGYDAVIVIAESWVATEENVPNVMYPDLSQVQGRVEALTVELETADGRSVMWLTPFRKKWSVRGKRVKLESTQHIEFDETPLGSMTPIRKVWDEQATE